MLRRNLPPTPLESETRIQLGGVPVNLQGFSAAVHDIVDRAASPGLRPLGVCSANLDHIRHFGSGSCWQGSLEHAAAVDWLTLLDGAPLVSEARRLTGKPWPRLAGSDLIVPVLEEAERRGLSVGILGGSERVHAHIREKFTLERPGLRIAGWWSPERSVIGDDKASQRLAAAIAESSPDILVIGLGKPRQELWANRYGHLTGAKVLLAFGAVVDFLAGDIQRAPSWMREKGLEWAWRLIKEPRRLGRRYLVDGPEAYLRLRRDSSALAASSPQKAEDLLSPSAEEPVDAPEEEPLRDFVQPDRGADIAVIVVTYNNGADIDPLMRGLRSGTNGLTLKVVVADNSPNAATRDQLSKHPDVVTVHTGGNLGYAGGINLALQAAGDARAYLILNPDLRLEPGAITAMWRRMMAVGAGMVVPVLLDTDGSVYHSLRREPCLTRALGDAAMGCRFAARPHWLSEIDFEDESYQHPHLVDWATGAALLIRADAMRTTGKWDERFFLYSEETDYCRRLREAGFSIWFEPTARIWHERGGSGQSVELMALMTVNRIRYARKHLGPRQAALLRAIVLAGEMARISKPGHGQAALTLMNQRRWALLPHASGSSVPKIPLEGFPSGAIIIPAHNEAAVLGRTLDALKPLASTHNVDVIVACNGCTDATEAVASRYPGVRVIRVAETSKAAALNAADAVTDRWPRLYLDADIELSPDAVRAVFDCLSAGPLLAARPAFRYDTTRASRVVKAYYRARTRIPGNSQGLWGAGVYALNAPGHARLGEFPPLTGDDLYVDQLFQPEEKAVLPTLPVVVRTPRTAGSLLAVLRRTYRGNMEQAAITMLRASGGRLSGGSSTRGTFRDLAHTVRGPMSALDAGVYAAFAVTGRRKVHNGPGPSRSWERDETSRG
ncbi:WecB/TagA/CpsF family glycosyltransferase [Paenarthrobacter nitroguajacolicus]|uniref:WecB/TagA/CpsF family glycosyltransferase n=1 Tax=Paenarthrobacter nitroguajacolicus TaxID=211146 RepID=UPI003D1AC466